MPRTDNSPSHAGHALARLAAAPSGCLPAGIVPRFTRLMNGSRRPWRRTRSCGGGAGSTGSVPAALTGAVARGSWATAGTSRTASSTTRNCHAVIRRRPRAGALPRRRAGAGASTQHERRRRARDVMRRVRRVAGVLRRISQGADVDDARELADAIEEQPEVVIAAFELQADRPLGVHVLGGDRLRPEAAHLQVRLRRQRLHAAQQIADVASRPAESA